MTIQQARSTKLEGGRWEGKTLAQVGRTRDGLRFLRLISGCRGWPEEIAEAARTYLATPEAQERLLWVSLNPRLFRRRFER